MSRLGEGEFLPPLVARDGREGGGGGDESGHHGGARGGGGAKGRRKIRGESIWK